MSTKNQLSSLEGVFYDYLRSSQAERIQADYQGLTSGTITYADSSTFTYTTLAQLDAQIAKVQDCYSGIIQKYNGNWNHLANQAKSLLENMLINGEFQDDGRTDLNGDTYNRKPLGVIQAFIDWCNAKAMQEASFTNGGIMAVVNVP